jgi:hypothetical protein
MELLILLAPMIVWFVVLLVRNKDLPKSVEDVNVPLYTKSDFVFDSKSSYRVNERYLDED